LGCLWQDSVRSYNPGSMNKLAQSISYVFHPLLMPTLGLLLILNSGTYLALLDPAAKRAILLVMAVGTFLFPLMAMPVLYYRKLLEPDQVHSKEGNLVPEVVILIIYIFTFIYFVRLPLSRVIQGYTLSAPLVLLLSMIAGLRFRVCMHMAALGGITGLIISLVILYQTPLQGFLVISLLVSGITGSARLATGVKTPLEILAGFALGFGVVMTTLLVY
jgi:hypothetical protein